MFCLYITLTFYYIPFPAQDDLKKEEKNTISTPGFKNHARWHHSEPVSSISQLIFLVVAFDFGFFIYRVAHEMSYHWLYT